MDMKLLTKESMLYNVMTNNKWKDPGKQFYIFL